MIVAATTDAVAAIPAAVTMDVPAAVTHIAVADAAAMFTIRAVDAAMSTIRAVAAVMPAQAGNT